MTFKNEKDLERFLLQKCRMAVIEAEKKVYAIIKDTLVEFYGEFRPEHYERTHQLLHSLVKTYVKSDGLEAEVYFDASLLNYETGTWDGDTVLKVAMESKVPHGGYGGADKDTAVWLTSQRRFQEEFGGIYKLLEQKLRAQGIPIKKG